MDQVPKATAVDNATVLDVEDLRTVFFTRQGLVKAVDGVSFSLKPGEILAIVGESGCGKSMTALSIMRLIPNPPGRIVGGAIRLDGRNLLELDEAAMRAVRGNDISMIFQEPMTSLNPVFTIGDQIAEGTSAAPGRSTRRSICSSWSASRSRCAARANIPTSCRAACASAP